MSPERGAGWPGWARVLVGVFASIGALYVGLLVLASFSSCFMMDSAVVPSMTGALVAKVSEVQCRSEDPAVEVSVTHIESERHSVREVAFRVRERRDEKGDFVKVPISVAWAGNQELQVFYPYALSFDSRAEYAMGVKVTYHEVSPGSR